MQITDEIPHELFPHPTGNNKITINKQVEKRETIVEETQLQDGQLSDPHPSSGANCGDDESKG